MYQVPIYIVLLGIAVFLLVIAGMVLFLGSRKTVIKRVTLRELSPLWVKGGNCEIHIAKLAPLWRDEKILTSQQSVVEFNHIRLTEFYNKNIKSPWFQNAGIQKEVCVQILQILDREGDCPSVVNAVGDVEGSWDKNTYNLLSRTTLLDHTINVANETVKILIETEAQHVIPDAIIAALGHDLGKLESIREYMYSLGEHPLAAGKVLAQIAAYKKLFRKEEITRAIKLHHKMPEGLLGKTLKKADQIARQKELEKAVEQLGKDQTPITQKTESKFAKAQAGNDSTAAWNAQQDIYGEEAPPAKKQGNVPKLMDISAWFEAQAFLNALKPYINKMFGRQFLAFSMPDGYVFFQVKVLEKEARKMAEKAGIMEIAAMDNGDKTMQQVLVTIVHHLRKEYDDVIAKEFIKEKYFGGYFTVTTKKGKTFKGYYTPFHAEAFGSIAEMESIKSDKLKNFMLVEPLVKK